MIEDCYICYETLYGKLKLKKPAIKAGSYGNDYSSYP